MKKYNSRNIIAGILTIPKDVREIGYEEYAGDLSIVSVTIPGTVKKIGARAFADCENLERVVLQEGIEEIESNAFSGCKKIRRVVYPDSVKVYQGWTFWNTCLDSPVLNASGTVLVFCPNSVTGKEWAVPDTVKTIAWQAFIDNENLERLHLPEGLEKIEEMAIIGCGIKELTIPASVRELCPEFAWRCEKLEKVTIMNPDTKIFDGAFSGCENLKEINCSVMNENDRLFHLKGMCFLTKHAEDPANLKHSYTIEFKRLAEKCAKGDSAAMEEMAEFFEEYSLKTDASPFYMRAANYWRYRAYRKGNSKAKEWFSRFFREHPGEHLESILSEGNVIGDNYFSFNIPGKMLNDLGYAFFDSDIDYEVKHTADSGLVLVGSFERWEAPDEDGFGEETYYNWWFLDENMQPIPGIGCVNSTLYQRRFAPFTTEKARAIEILKKRTE